MNRTANVPHAGHLDAAHPAPAAAAAATEHRSALLSMRRDGARRPDIFVRWREPAPGARPARPPVVVVHGFGEHSGRYLRVLDAIAEAGHAVVALDRRGYGRSAGRRGFVRSFADYLEDVELALQHAARLTGDASRPILLGHSMGGLVALDYALAHGERLGGLVLSSPALRFRVEVPAWKHLIGLAASRLWPTLSLPTGRDPSLLSRDPRNEREIHADPWIVARATARWYTESRRAQRRVLAAAGTLQVPSLFLVAGDDRVVDPEATRRFYAGVPSSQHSWHRFEHGRHELFQELPELRDEVLRTMLQWLAAQRP
jgi:lysophospholipase